MQPDTQRQQDEHDLRKGPFVISLGGRITTPGCILFPLLLKIQEDVTGKQQNGEEDREIEEIQDVVEIGHLVCLHEPTIAEF
jgi:hypothetical protein